MNIGTDYIGVTVVYFCHDGKGNFVMARRSEQARDDQGKWDIGGGKIEPHDSVEDSLRREIKEEYCADVIDFKFLGYRDVHRMTPDGHPTHWIALDHAVLVDPSQVKNGELHKFTDLQWFTLDSRPGDEELHSQLPTFFSNYSDAL